MGVSVKDLVNGTFYKIVGTAPGLGVFYITATRAWHYKQLYSYKRYEFATIYSKGEFYELTFKEVLATLLKDQAIDEESLNGKMIRYLVGQPYEIET